MAFKAATNHYQNSSNALNGDLCVSYRNLGEKLSPSPNTQPWDKTAIVASHMTESKQEESCTLVNEDNGCERLFTLHQGPQTVSEQTNDRLLKNRKIQDVPGPRCYPDSYCRPV